MKQIDAEKAMARYFYEQCAGSFSGHMANVPNNPVLHAMVGSFGVETEHDFAALLRLFADALEAWVPVGQRKPESRDLTTIGLTVEDRVGGRFFLIGTYQGRLIGFRDRHGDPLDQCFTVISWREITQPQPDMTTPAPDTAETETSQ